MKKIRAYSREMIRRVIATDLKLEMLRPLLFDEKINTKWDGTYGVHGLQILRMTLYFDLIREMSAISLDKYSSSPSIYNILELLKSESLSNALKTDYCKPLETIWVGDVDEASKKFWEEEHKKKTLIEGKERFESYLNNVKKSFEKLTNTNLYERIKKSRNKLIAHYEMHSDGGELRLFDPTDFDLKWHDPEDYYNKIKPIIVEIVLLTSNESYSLDSNNNQHKMIANEFWKK